MFVFVGVVNTLDDPVSKDFGTHFGKEVVLFYSELMPELVEKTFFKVAEISGLKQNNKKSVVWNYSIIQLEEVLYRLQEKGWLQKNAKGFWLVPYNNTQRRMSNPYIFSKGIRPTRLP
jgi:hypothetical protein